MSKRKKPEARCPRCLMRWPLCFCEQLVPHRLKSRIIIIGRAKEIIQPSNTARFVSLVLPNSSLYLRGQADQNFDLTLHAQAQSPCFMLYPDPSAPIIEDLDPQLFPDGINLIVPDGNWRQTSKVRRREPALANIPILQIRAQQNSLYQIRTERKDHGLATLEAIAFALGALEGKHIEYELINIVKTLAERTMIARGTKTLKD